MTTTDLERLAAAAAPVAGSQGTVIEQSRAVAEVLASVELALRRPRDITRALASMRDACGLRAVAEAAFFSYSRAGSTVSGPSIHLARELARCWGNVQYGITELSRDDVAGESQMVAWAWDLESNLRPSSTFVVPHVRWTKTAGRKVLDDPRDVYENNANAGARRVREMLFAVMPRWFTEEAKGLCQKALEHGGGVPLAHRVDQVVEWYGRELQVTDRQLVEHVGRATGQWTARDVAALGVLFRSLQAGETTVAEVFGDALTSDDVRAQAAASRKPARKRDGAVVEDPPEYDPTADESWGNRNREDAQP